MAYAFVQSGENHNTTGVGSALTASSITVSAGNTLVVWICTLTTGSQTLSGNGNTYTYVGTSAALNAAFLSAYYCQNINAGATAVATSDTGCFGIYAAEYSGLATSGGLAGAFISTTASGPGAGANIISLGATNVTVAPAAVFACGVDSSAASSGSGNTGNITAGTTLTWISRTLGWVDGAAVLFGRGEDIRAAVTGNVTPTIGVSGNKQFANFLAAAFALGEPGQVTPPPVPSRGPMPKQIYIMP